jgi:hypothetical protein
MCERFPTRAVTGKSRATAERLPSFSRNGKDLFFFDPTDDRIMVAGYSVRGDSFVADKPRVWSGQSVALTLSGAVGAQYDLARDGKRIAVATDAGGSTQPNGGHVIFLENFVDELQRKIPLNGP